MPRGRKPLQLTPTVEPNLDVDRIEHAVEVMRQVSIKSDEELAAIKRGLSDDRDLVNQLLGQVQMARSFARFADVVSLTKLKHIKETKMYRALAGKKAFDPDGNEIADVGTFDGFCQALGLSRSKVDEDLTNLTAFGEEAMKSLSAIGIGYRELRQYRRLPEDQRSALIEVAKTGSKEDLEEIAEEMLAKLEAEKSKALDDLAAEKEASRRIIQSRDESINAKQDEIDRLNRELGRNPPKPIPTPALREADDLAALGKSVFEIVAAVDAGLRSHFVALDRHYEPDCPPNHIVLAKQNALVQVIQIVNTLASDHYVTIPLRSDIPARLEWMKNMEMVEGIRTDDGTPNGVVDMLAWGGDGDAGNDRRTVMNPSDEHGCPTGLVSPEPDLDP